MHQTVLPSIHISFTGISTPQLNSDISLISCQLFFFSLFERLAVCIVPWVCLCLLTLRSHDLELFSALQKNSVFLKYLILELLEVLQHSSLLQLSFSQLSSSLLPQLLSLSFELYAQPDKTLLLLPVRPEAATAPHVFSVFLILQHHFGKYQKGQKKT